MSFTAPDPVVTNVLWGASYLYTAPEGTDLPDDSTLDGAVFPTPWTYSGATSEGVKITFDPKTQDITIEEQSLPAATLIASATFVMELSLSEATLQNIQLAYGGGGQINITAPATGQPGKSVLTLSEDFPILSAALVGKNLSGMTRVFYVPRILSAGSVETDFRRADSQQLYPATLNAVCPLGDIQVIDITDPPTA